MKTNKFEEILRRKLESIQPDFQDQDWDKWQAFRQHHTPSFWQSYGHWLGYAVATLTTAIMIVLYVQQSDQNETLRQEMEELKKQMQATNDSAYTPGAAGPENRVTGPVRDTVYIIERQMVYRDVPGTDVPEAGISHREVEQPREQNPATLPAIQEKGSEGIASLPAQEVHTPAISPDTRTDSRVATQEESPVPEGNTLSSKRAISAEKQSPANRIVNREPNRTDTRPLDEPTRADPSSGIAPREQATPPASSARQPDVSQKAYTERIELGELTELPRTQEFSNSRNYLYRRLQARMPRKAQVPAVAQAEPEKNRNTVDRTIREEKSDRRNAPPVQSSSDQKIEEIKKEENLLPNFGLGLPYRAGVSQAWIGNTRAFTVWGEFLISKQWSVQTGLRWHRLQDQRFYNEKMFRDDMREDFRQEHAKKLPPSFEIFNINTQTTLLQIPLGLTYRGEIGNHFTYLIGTGTNLNVQARQLLTYDFRLPTRDYGQQEAERYVHIPVINNAQIMAGLEKRWSPIVLQVNSFLETRLKTYPFLKDRSNIGFQIKILYEFGDSKKN